MMLWYNGVSKNSPVVHISKKMAVDYDMPDMQTCQMWRSSGY